MIAIAADLDIVRFSASIIFFAVGLEIIKVSNIVKFRGADEKDDHVGSGSIGSLLVQLV